MDEIKVHELFVSAAALKMPSEIYGDSAAGICGFTDMREHVYTKEMYRDALAGTIIYIVKVPEDSYELIRKIGVPAYDYFGVHEGGKYMILDTWLKPAEVDVEPPSQKVMRELGEMSVKLDMLKGFGAETIEEALKAMEGRND